MHKSPLFGLLLVPVSPLQEQLDFVALAAPIMNGLLLAQVAVLGWLCGRLQIHPVLWLAASASIFLNQVIVAQAGALMADMILSVTVANIILLPAVESGTSRSSARQDLLRGVLWSTQCSVAILTKLTAGMFIIGVLPVAFLARRGCMGTASACTSLAVAACLSTPAALVLILDWRALLLHASQASFGNLASFYSDGLELDPFSRNAFNATGVGGCILLGLACFALAALWRVGPRLCALWPVLLLSSYFALVAASPNRDARFLLPFWVARSALLLGSVHVQEGNSKGAAVLRPRSRILTAGRRACTRGCAANRTDIEYV